jgi:hypothetical protein
MLHSSDGTTKSLALEPKCVADFYAQCMAMLQATLKTNSRI